jgi:hypothetical protein
MKETGTCLVPLLRFRVYPTPDRGPKAPYFRVHVWPSRPAMWLHLDLCDIKHDRCVAICAGYEVQRRVHGRWRPIPCLGEIDLARTRCGVGVVAHECCHAALRFADRTGIDYRAGMRPHEERVCWALGNMTRQIYLRLNRLVQ